MDFNKTLNSNEYSFLNERFNDNIMILTTGGSHAYGTNVDNDSHISDIDIRGVYHNSKREILTMNCKNKPYEHSETDTVIYPFRQIIDLLTNVNPNVIEIFGTKQEHVFRISDEGELLKNNIDLFLSQRAANSFGGYAIAQLRRLQNALARDSYPQKEKEQHILQSMHRQMKTFEENYTPLTNNKLNLYIDKSEKSDMDEEIFFDINMSKYPIRDFKSMMNELNNIVKDYSKLNHRNSKKDEIHLNKHAMHLIRLFLMGTEILEGKGINTYRYNDKGLLLDIRNGKYSYDDIFEMVDELQARFKYAENNTSLPKKPNVEKISDLVLEINSSLLRR